MIRYLPFSQSISKREYCLGVSPYFFAYLVNRKFAFRLKKLNKPTYIHISKWFPPVVPLCRYAFQPFNMRGVPGRPPSANRSPFISGATRRWTDQRPISRDPLCPALPSLRPSHNWSPTTWIWAQSPPRLRGRPSWVWHSQPRRYAFLTLLESNSKHAEQSSHSYFFSICQMLSSSVKSWTSCSQIGATWQKLLLDF